MSNSNIIYTLISEDLSHLGGMMGSDYTTKSIMGNFSGIEKAKKAAEKDYGKSIKWAKKNSPTVNGIPIDETCSGDLNYIMYHIRKMIVR